MSYQEKRSIVSIITGIFILAAYCIYTSVKYQSGAISSGNIKDWAIIMLVFIGIGIVASIIIQIIFHILLSIGIAVSEKIKNEKCEEREIEKTIRSVMVTDEMDKLIELKSMRVGFAIAGIGFIFALLSQIFNYSPAVMLNIMFISYSAGSIIEGITQIIYYKKGIKNG